MDITYTIPQLGVSEILLNFDVETESPTFLIVLTDPCGLSTKNALFTPTKCNENWNIIVDAVNRPYESLTDGAIFFDQLGTWDAAIYSQANLSNTDPNNAVFVADALFQVVCDDDVLLLDKLLDLPL